MIENNDYYLMLARAVAKRANCKGRDVGAVVVKSDRILAMGYNGTPEGMPNCEDGGCLRCDGRENGRFTPGRDYDLCSCVHAEANAIATAARFGIPLDGSILYTTDQPCFSCSKELIQTGIVKVYFAHFWQPNPEAKDDYTRLQNRLLSEQRSLKEAEPPPIRERPHCNCPTCHLSTVEATSQATGLLSTSTNSVAANGTKVGRA